MTRYALINSVIYTGTEILRDYAVIIDNDTISAVIPQAELPKNINTIDLDGHNLTAGFIDLQVNGCGGVMFNCQPSVETLEIMQKTNLKSGTTSYLPTLITAPDETIKSAVETMREYLSAHKNQALGLHLEGPYLSVEKRGIHQAEYIRTAAPEMIRFLCNNADVVRKITLAAENPTAEHIPMFVKRGIVVSIGHSNADYDTAKRAFRRGASFATHLYNAMSPIGSARTMGVVGAVLDSPVYSGIILDGLHVAFGNARIAKAVKQERLCIVTDATAAAGADIDAFDFVGTTVYVRNGRCYGADGTLGGSSITMIESVRNAVEQVGIPLDEALRMATLYPARAINIAHKLGSIEAGKIANLTVFTQDYRIIGTVLNGCWQSH